MSAEEPPRGDDSAATPAVAAAMGGLRCPFCGGRVDFHRAQGHAWHPPDWWGTCLKESCAGRMSEPEGQWHTLAAAVAGWCERPGRG